MRIRLLPIILGLLLLLTAVCPLTAAAVSDPTGTDAPLPECFQQADARWADKELLGSNGCGLLALVNAVNYLTGNFIDPVELAVYAHRIDAYNGSVGGGTARWVLYNQLARYEKQYGFSVTDTGMDAGVRHRDFIRNLQQGGVAVCHVYGHFITIVDYDADADSYLVYDSAANPTKRNTTASPTWLSGEYLSTSAYMTVDWWCLLERAGDSRNTIGDRVRRNQPVELYRRVQPGTALTLTGTASASGGIRSLFYVVDYDYDNTVELPDSVTAEANTEAAFSVSPDLERAERRRTYPAAVGTRGEPERIGHCGLHAVCRQRNRRQYGRIHRRRDRRLLRLYRTAVCHAEIPGGAGHAGALLPGGNRRGSAPGGSGFVRLCLRGHHVQRQGHPDV